jgi:hypothetical protein
MDQGMDQGMDQRASADTFLSFWSVYPSKVAKPRAERAYAKALKRVTAETIVTGAERYANDPNRDPSFTRHPATWLNDDGWNDGPLPARPRGRDPTHNGALIDSVADELTKRPLALGRGSP